MIRSLIYHFFWNFYDYLGSYLLLGAIITGAMLGAASLASLLASHLPDPTGKMAVLAIAASLVVTIKLLGVAGLFGFADKAARDEAARLPDFRKSIRVLLPQYLKVAALTLLIIAVGAVDVVAYWKMGISTKIPALRTAFGIIAMVLAWLTLGFYLYLFPLAAAPARFVETKRLKDIMRKAFVLFSLYPMFWVTTAITFTVLAGICLISVVGIIFLLPIFASLSATAFDIALRQTEFLTQAREELGPGATIATYRRRASELAFEWEARQPQRTFRELIKPWEN